MTAFFESHFRHFVLTSKYWQGWEVWLFTFQSTLCPQIKPRPCIIQTHLLKNIYSRSIFLKVLALFMACIQKHKTDQIWARTYGIQWKKCVRHYAWYYFIQNHGCNARGKNWMLWKGQSKESAIFPIILWQFLVIFSTTTFLPFTKLKIRRSFWGAEQV